MEPKKTGRYYDQEFKREAVRLTYEPGRTIVGVARSLGIHENTLSIWRQQLAQPSDSGATEAGQGTSEEELRRLRRELAQVTQERDILKKALAYFSRNES